MFSEIETDALCCLTHSTYVSWSLVSGDQIPLSEILCLFIVNETENQWERNQTASCGSGTQSQLSGSTKFRSWVKRRLINLCLCFLKRNENIFNTS